MEKVYWAVELRKGLYFPGLDSDERETATWWAAQWFDVWNQAEQARKGAVKTWLWRNARIVRLVIHL
jgi:hypothetical protein